MSPPRAERARARSPHHPGLWPDECCRQAKSTRSRIPERRPRGNLFGTRCRELVEARFYARSLCRTKTTDREREPNAFRCRETALCSALVPHPLTSLAGWPAEDLAPRTGTPAPRPPALLRLPPRVAQRARRLAA